jgi:hypothetical protein
VPRSCSLPFGKRIHQRIVAPGLSTPFGRSLNLGVPILETLGDQLVVGVEALRHVNARIAGRNLDDLDFGFGTGLIPCRRIALRPAVKDAHVRLDFTASAIMPHQRGGEGASITHHFSPFSCGAMIAGGGGVRR